MKAFRATATVLVILLGVFSAAAQSFNGLDMNLGNLSRPSDA